MKKEIAACGNDCAVCPRHLPKTEDELAHTAQLWKKIGYRDCIISNEEISCTGCKPENWCRYKIINCVEKKGIANCGCCEQYPCETILECFEVTESFAPGCRASYTEEEYEMLRKAFFCKKANLDDAVKKRDQ